MPRWAAAALAPAERASPRGGAAWRVPEAPPPPLEPPEQVHVLIGAALRGGVRIAEVDGLLRQYFPKGFDFSTVTEPELDAIADELNARPRKHFDFATATEQLSQLLLQ